LDVKKLYLEVAVIKQIALDQPEMTK